MSSNIPAQNPIPEMTGRQMGFLIGTAIGMVFLLYLIRYACYIVVIDVCILGDCSALKKLFCCCRSDDDDDDDDPNRPPRQWRGSDVPDLRTIGAFSDPAGFLYNNIIPEETRNAFLDLITDSEILDCKNHTSTESQTDEDQKKAESESSRSEENAMEEGSSVMSDIDHNACSICLLSLDGDVCSLQNCSHSFHRECIKNWIARSLNCPVCRKQMIDNDKLLDYISSNKKLFTMNNGNHNDAAMER